MSNAKQQLSEKDILLLNAASDLARVQLRRAVTIVGEVTGREENEVDSSLVGAMVQVLATNYMALVTSESASGKSG